MGKDFVDDFGSEDSGADDDIRGNSASDRGADSPAPVPPHERVWRHPSEIGFATVASIDDQPINIGRNGRSLVGIASVAGIAIGIALAVALQPGSLRSNPNDVLALTNSRLRIASLDFPERAPDRIAAHAESVPGANDPLSIDRTTFPSDSRLLDSMQVIDDSESTATQPTQPQATSTTVAASRAVSAGAVGVLSESGDHLLTTMAAVNGIESIDVRLPNGTMVRSRIVHALPDVHIAILSVSDESTTGARADIKASGLSTDGDDYFPGQPVIVLVESPLEFVIGGAIDEVLVALDTHSSSSADRARVAEGAPVVSKSGHLLGLCTHAGGRLGFVPVSLFESALSKMFNDVVATTTLPPQ